MRPVSPNFQDSDFFTNPEKSKNLKIRTHETNQLWNCLSPFPIEREGCYTTFNTQGGGVTPNWQHNSGKSKNTKGSCKGKLKARKQALQHIKRKLKVI